MSRPRALKVVTEMSLKRWIIHSLEFRVCLDLKGEGYVLRVCGFYSLELVPPIHVVHGQRCVAYTTDKTCSSKPCIIDPLLRMKSHPPPYNKLPQYDTIIYNGDCLLSGDSGVCYSREGLTRLLKCSTFKNLLKPDVDQHSQALGSRKASLLLIRKPYLLSLRIARLQDVSSIAFSKRIL